MQVFHSKPKALLFHKSSPDSISSPYLSRRSSSKCTVSAKHLTLGPWPETVPDLTCLPICCYLAPATWICLSAEEISRLWLHLPLCLCAVNILYAEYIELTISSGSISTSRFMNSLIHPSPSSSYSSSISFTKSILYIQGNSKAVGRMAIDTHSLVIMHRYWGLSVRL